MAEASVRPQQHWSFGLSLRGGAALAASLVIAGCQTIPRGPAPAPAPTPTETPAPSPFPDDRDRHRVAMLVPMTGTNAGVGQSLANAANLAVLDTGGRRIRITTYDTATGAAAAAQRAVAEGNKVILGPLLAEDVRLIAPIAQRARVPLISFSNDTSVAGEGTFILGYSPAQSIDRVVRYARTRGVSKFAGLIPAGLYGQRASTQLLRSVESAGGQVVTMQTFDRSRQSLSAAVTRMAKDSPYEAVLVADGGRIAVQAVPLIRKSGGQGARVLGTELWNTEPSLTQNAAMHGAWFASVSDGLYRQLAAKYRSRYNSAPYRISSLGYDAVLLVTRIAQDWRPGTAFPVRALLDSGGFSGIDGAFRFDESGIAERALEVQQIGVGGFTTVSPAPARFSE